MSSSQRAKELAFVYGAPGYVSACLSVCLQSLTFAFNISITNEETVHDAF